jgi:zeta-carotene desaturase
VERFWKVVLVSALNEELERISAFHGTEVFRKGFLVHRRGFEMGVPIVPLGELYNAAGAGRSPRRADSSLTVVLRRGVDGISITDGLVRHAILDDGEAATADYFVSALPFDAILELLPDELLREYDYFRRWNALQASPITGIHLWFDRKVMDEPYLTPLERTLQWIFNKSALYGRADEGTYLLCVVSASHALVTVPRSQIIELALRELAEILPETRTAKLTKATVIKEIRATHAPAPGTEVLRPSPQTPLNNFFVCGDWTATGWPGTMESAVRSGFACAEAILAREGQPESILRADLPIRGLAKLLAG